MQIIEIDPLVDPRWETLLMTHHSDIFQSPAWMKSIADTYGFGIRAYILLDQAGQPRAGVPFCAINDMRGQRVLTLPFSDYCDPLVSNLEDWHCLTERLLAKRCPYTIRCLHNAVPLADERLTLSNQAKWHSLDLTRDLDTIWEGLDSSARRAIRKAERAGVVIRIAENEADLRAFFGLHVAMRKYKYRLLAQPYQFFKSIWDNLVQRNAGFVLLASYQDQVIGGILFLEWKDGLYYKINASAQAQLQVRPNDLLIWNGIQYGQAKGYKFLDFGLSDWDQEGLLRYKRKFATEEKTISFLRYLPPLELSLAQQQVQGLLPLLTELFTETSVPDPITERAGDILYRYFS